jgi:ABC-type Fe3+ transport system permease subunit
VKRRSLILAPCVASWTVFILAVVWPTAALIGRCIVQGAAPEGGFSFSARQLGLLWRSLWLSVVATGLCILISLPGAYVIGRLRGLAHRPLIAALLMMCLLSPPMVYAFGWERILPATFNPYVRCIGVWALWAWPIPALLIGTGWSRAGLSAYEAALTVASPATAFARVGLPVVRPYVALAGLVVFALYFSDYGVPHACFLNVYATELLGRAESHGHVIDTAWPALLSGGVTGVSLCAMYLVWRAAAADIEDDGRLTQAVASTSPALTAAALLCFLVSWGLPIGALAGKFTARYAVVEALRTYATDLSWSLGVSVMSGLLAVAMGLGLVTAPRSRGVSLIWAVAFGALPGALIGASLVAAYNNHITGWLYDNCPIVAVSYISRFGWIGVLTALVVKRTSVQSLIDQARTDGASDAAILARIQIPASWPALLCGAAIVAAMSVADVATSSLVRVPSFSPIAHVLIEKFHRFEEDMLVSLSLLLVFATLPPALLFTLALARRRAG